MSFISNAIGNVAYFFHARGDLARAEVCYKRAVAFGKLNAKFEGTYGVLLLKRGEFDHALEQFNKSLERRECKGKLRAMVRMNRAIAYFRKGEVQKAVVALEDIHQNFKGLRVYQTLGYVYTAAGLFDKAEPYNLEALEYDNDDHVILDNTGQMYYEMGQYDKAKDYFVRAYEQKHVSDVCYHMGLISEHEGEMEQALEYYREALNKNMDALNDVTPEKLQSRIAAVEAELGVQDVTAEDELARAAEDAAEDGEEEAAEEVAEFAMSDDADESTADDNGDRVEQEDTVQKGE
jgi:tetratricopeptide (TPR) repeat protein